MAVRESGDSEVVYWEGLGFKVYKDDSGRLVASNKWGFLRDAFAEQPVAEQRVKVDPLQSKQRKKKAPVYPGEGASDDQWRRYAAERYDVPGAIVKVPQIGKGKRRGLDILNLIRGNSIEYSWPCGCRQVGDKYIPCGTKSCDLNQ